MTEQAESPLQDILKRYTNAFMARSDNRLNVEVRVYPEELAELGQFLLMLFEKRPKLPELG